MLLEHPALAEAAVVPSPDPLRLSVPKAYIALTAGTAPDATRARSIFKFFTMRVSLFKRIRRLEFAELPKTISGKIRRGKLRQAETACGADGLRREHEYWEEDFAEPL